VCRPASSHCPKRLRGRKGCPLVWLFPKHENRQPTKAIRYQAHGGIKKICTFNKDSAGRDDGFSKMPVSA